MSDDGAHSDLSEVSTSALERLRGFIAARSIALPITLPALLAHGFRHNLEALTFALSGHSSLACISVLDVALSERRSHTRVEPELVWTGPERAHATARDSAVVLRALFESAQRQVLLAGFSFERGPAVLAPLHAAMVARGLDVRFFVHMQQAEAPLTDPDGGTLEERSADSSRRAGRSASRFRASTTIHGRSGPGRPGPASMRSASSSMASAP